MTPHARPRLEEKGLKRGRGIVLGGGSQLSGHQRPISCGNGPGEHPVFLRKGSWSVGWETPISSCRGLPVPGLVTPDS